MPCLLLVSDLCGGKKQLRTPRGWERVDANWWIGVGGGLVRVGWRRLVMWAARTGRSNSPLHPLLLGGPSGNM